VPDRFVLLLRDVQTDLLALAADVVALGSDGPDRAIDAAAVQRVLAAVDEHRSEPVPTDFAVLGGSTSGVGLLRLARMTVRRAGPQLCRCLSRRSCRAVARRGFRERAARAAAAPGGVVRRRIRPHGPRPYRAAARESCLVVRAWLDHTEVLMYSSEVVDGASNVGSRHCRRVAGCRVLFRHSSATGPVPQKASPTCSSSPVAPPSPRWSDRRDRRDGVGAGAAPA